MTKRETPAPGHGRQGLDYVFCESNSSTKFNLKSKRPGHPSKKKRVAIALTQRRYNRFEAERELADHCLHSTVSTLQNQHGILVSREWETVPGYQGIPTRCCRYWIAPEYAECALKLAEGWR